MTTTIVGAGWLGREVAAALPGPVIATSRSGQWPDPPPHVTVRALDVTTAIDPTPLRATTRVVLAFAPGLGRATGHAADATRRELYVDGTARILGALPQLERIVYVGSTSSLPDLDAWLDESCDAPADSDRGRVQRDAEAVVLAHGASAMVLRMGGLFGPGRELSRVYGKRDPGSPMAGDGMAPTNLVHRDDAVAAIVAALTRPDARGVVHVVADGHLHRRAMMASVAARHGAAIPTWSDAAGPIPRGKRIGNHRLKTILGVRLQHPWPA